jgi:inorganic triphosphatase YgiF
VHTEIELKLSLDPGAVKAPQQHPAVKALRAGRMRTARIDSSYYDTGDSLLAGADVALRVRRIGKRWVQTIKGPAESASGGGLFARAEFEWPLSRPMLDYAQLSTTPWNKLIAKARKRGGLARRFTTDFERRTIPLGFPDGTRAELCVDLGEIRATQDGETRRAPIAEIELELEKGSASNLFGLARRLAEDLPVAVMTMSKAERGYALLSGERDVIGTPARADSVPLAEYATTDEALAALARGCLQQIAANAPGLLADDDVEWVHQMRIGTRRLRSCLRLVAHCAPSGELRRLTDDARWLAEALGAARDWDVFVHETLPPLAAWFARDRATAPGLKRLRARAEARRRLARTAAREAVGSARFQRMLLAGGYLCAAPRFATERPPNAAQRDDVLGGRAADFAASLLARRHRKLERSARALESGSPEERHAVRIAAKRLRYVAEFFAPLFPRKRAKAYLKALTAVQDVLGRLNDAATALRVANESGGTQADAATGAVRGWVAAQAVALEPKIASAWRRFARAKRFWVRSS